MNVGERAHLDAWKAATAAVTTVPAYEWDETPRDANGNKIPFPPLYTLVAAVRRYDAGSPRATGQRAVIGWRLVTRFVGTTNREVLWLIEKFSAGLEDQQLLALDATPLELETPADPPEAAEQGKRREAEVLWTYCT